MSEKEIIRKFPGLWFPIELWNNPELTWMEKLFLLEIDSLDNEKGCYASNAYIAKIFQLSKSRCSQIISSLEKKKYIKIQLFREGKVITKRLITIHPDVVNFLKGGSKYSKGGYLENAKEERTSKESTRNKNSYKNKNIVVSKKKPQDSSLFNSFVPIEKNIYSLLVKTLPITFRNRLPAAGVKPTALLYQTESLILAIREGRFFRDVTISEQKQEDWIAGIRIVRSLKGSSWEDIGKVLKRAAKRYQMMLSPKYGFPNKKGMTRDINIFLYNPNSQNSWFLECLSHKPKQNSQYIDNHNIKRFQSDIPAEALSALTKFKRTNWDEGGYWKKARDLYEWYEDEKKRLKGANPNWSAYCGRFERLLARYEEFTEGWDVFTIGHFGAENKTWDRFIDWMRTEYEVEMNPKKRCIQTKTTKIRKTEKEKTERDIIAERLVSEGICENTDEAVQFADAEVIQRELRNEGSCTYVGI
jgi:hypothetical protein